MSKRSPFVSKALSDTIAVQNLNYGENEQTIKAHFSREGKIKKIELVKDKKNQFKGLAYITYQNAEEAKNAVNTFNYTFLNNKQLAVKFHKERKKSEQPKEKETKEQLTKRLKSVEKELKEITQLLKEDSKSTPQKKTQATETKDDTINFTKLVPVGKAWTVELSHRNILMCNNKRYVVEASSVDRLNEGESYPYYLFLGKNGWSTDKMQGFASINIIFSEPVLANVLTMTPKKGIDFQQAPTKFEVIGIKDGIFKTLKKFNNISWASKTTQIFTFSNRTKYPEYRMAFYENVCPDKQFGLAGLNLGVRT